MCSDKQVEDSRPVNEEEEEELKPLINDESHEEAQSIDSPKVKFNDPEQSTEQFPLESRLKYVRLVNLSDFLKLLFFFLTVYFTLISGGKTHLIISEIWQLIQQLVAL